MERKISVSMLAGYLYCKRKLFLQYVLRLEEPDKSALAKGSIRHEAYEGINLIDEDLVKGVQEGEGFEEIRQRYLNAYSAILRNRISQNLKRLKAVNVNPIELYKQTLPYFEKESLLRTEHIFKFISKHKVYGEELWNVLIPKLQVEVNIASEKFGIKGIVDRIEVYPEGLVPVELKTGKAPSEGVWPGHKIQIGAYAMLMEEHYGKDIKEGFVHYLDNDERIHIAINPFLKDEILSIKEQVKALLESRELPKTEKNENKCSKCGLKLKCFDENLLKCRLNEIRNK